MKNLNRWLDGLLHREDYEILDSSIIKQDIFFTMKDTLHSKIMKTFDLSGLSTFVDRRQQCGPLRTTIY